MTDDIIRVLIVDDEESFLQPLSDLLGQKGFAVEGACSGPEAIAKAVSCGGQYEVALIDQALGPPNGTAIMCRLKERFPSIEVIILTGWGDMGPGEKAMELGAYRYMSKPINNMDELVLTVRTAARFGRERQRRIMLEALVQAGQQISGARTEAELYECIYRQVNGLVPDLEGLLISRWDAMNQTVYFPFCQLPNGRGSRPARHGFNGVTEYVIRTREPLLLPEGGMAFRQIHGLDAPMIIGCCTSEIIVPMFSEGQVTGTIYAFTYNPELSYTREHLAVIQAIANQAAAALTNARQLEESRQLGEALAGLSEQMSLETVLRAIVSAAFDLIAPDYAHLILRDSDGTLHKARPFMPENSFDDFDVPRRQGGLTSWVIENRRPKIVEDIDKEGPVKESLKRLGIHSILAMPLIYGNDVLGVLFACKRDAHHFGQHDINLWKAFATHAATALHAAQERERRIEQAQQLAVALSNLTERVSLHEMLRRLANTAKLIFGAGTCHLAYIEPSTQAIREWVWADGDPEALRTRAAPRPRGLTQHILGTGLPIFREDATHAPVGEPETYPELLVLGAKSIASFPLEYGGKIIAVLHLSFFDRKRQFGAGDRAQLQAFAAPAAAALQGALEGERLNRALNALFEIFAALRSPTDEESLLDSVAWHVASALDIDVCTILTYDPKTESFVNHGVAGAIYPMEPFASPRKERFQEWLEQTQPVLVANAQQDQRMRNSQFVAREGIRTAMVCPLRVLGEQEPLGLLFANYRYDKLPTEDEARALDRFSDLISLMVYETRLRRQLEETKNRLTRHTVLVWTSMIEDTWRHALVQKASSIRLNVGTLLRKLDLPLREDHLDIRDVLVEIDELAEKIAKAPPRVPQSWEMEPETVPLKPLLEGIAQREDRPGALDGSFMLHTQLDALSGVQLSGYRRWLIYAIQVLLENARRALPPSGGQIIIAGSCSNKWAEVRIIDTGSGVPKSIQGALFRELIPKAGDAQGMGLGALLAATIVEEHGGTISLEDPGPGHTTVLIRLPTEKTDAA